MASWDTSATQNVTQLIAGSGVALSPLSGQGIVTVSATGGGGGGVTALVAGSNITLSPTSGLGTVTINASGGGGGFISTATSQLDMTSYPILVSSITGLSSVNGLAYPSWVSTVTNRLDMNVKNTVNQNTISGANPSPLEYLTAGTGQASGVPWSRVASTTTGVFYGVQANRTTAGYIFTGGSSVTTGLWTQRTSAGRRLWSGITARGGSGWACVYGDRIYRSTNNGVSWTVNAGSFTMNWSGICSSENDTLKCVACVNGGGIYYTSNGGTTWSLTGAPSSLAWGGIAMAQNLSYVVAFTDTQVYYCTDAAGLVWNLVPAQPILPVGSTWSDVALNSYNSDIFFITTSTGVAYRVSFSFASWNDLGVPGTCVAMTPGNYANGVVVGDAITGQLSVSIGNNGLEGSFYTTKTIAGAAWTGVAIACLTSDATTPNSSNYTNICGVLASGGTWASIGGSLIINSGRDTSVYANNTARLQGTRLVLDAQNGMLIQNNISTAITIANTYGQPIILQTDTLQYSAPTNAFSYTRQPFVQWGTATGSGVSGTVVVTTPQAYTTSSSYVAQVTMRDAPTAQLYATPTASNSFTIGWTSAGSGTQTIMWTTFGN